MPTPLSQVLIDNPGMVADLRFACVASVSMPAGTPVAINPATGKLAKGDSTYKPYAFIEGLLAQDVLANFVGSVASFRCTLSDWTTITGAQLLLVGQNYFLSGAGGLSTVVPGSGCVTLVGSALDVNTLQINPQPPIQL